ncbi:cytochrome-c oxidase, cbb3-type subunit III [Helicobacter felis]|uniref:Cytochrome c oxidase subunit III n=1 Tax=Helicobacter felis (strain ATCC 49179 / CCUG 28539 / NCTC 12436 / CS1) TaxID=936155 RepID=E7AAJ7_HELFC|nr:cytochrome-c oxidase, cbb3-type subunit III [Helicobacter felis]CBY83517.1 cb-type cytochrome C oxidase subunit III [Helicobacter felis ATCC 49179]
MEILKDHINSFALVAALVILVVTLTISSSLFKAMREKTNEGVFYNNGHQFDGIGEFLNNIPTGWVVSFLVAITWGVWYIFFGYPVFSYSQIGEYNKEVARYNESFETRWKSLSVKDLTQMGQGIFLVQCSQCHGLEATGLDNTARNLVKWGKEEGIMEVIDQGSVGLGYQAGEMPPLGLPADDAKAVASFVMAKISSLKHTRYPQLVQKGEAIFASTCASCHGPDGKGQGGMAADLTRYGTPVFLKEILEKGKKGHIGEMPSFAYRHFNEIQVNALAHYIQSLQGEE